MAKVTAIVGPSGSGKTLLLSQFAYRNWFLGRRIYSNYDLDFNTPRTDMDTRLDNESLNYTPIFRPKDLFKVTDGSVLFLSELDTFGAEEDYKGGVDSYDYKSPSATFTEKFFKKRLRKMHCAVYYDVQQLGMIPKRIRDETIWVYEPYIFKWGLKGKDIVPYILHYRIRKLDNITGEHVPTGTLKNLVHPIFGHDKHPVYGYIKHITSDMLTIYDTDADPFKEGTGIFGNKGKHDPEEPLFKNEKKVMDRIKKKLPEATITAIPGSGLGSKKHGDLEVEFPKNTGIPKIIIEVKGIGKSKDKTVLSLNTRIEDGTITNWAGGLAYDQEYGSKHLGAYVDPFKKKIFVFDIKDNFGYLNKRQFPYIEELIGITEINKFIKGIRTIIKPMEQPYQIIKNIKDQMANP